MEKEALVIIDLQVGIQSEGNSLYNINSILEGVNERIRVFRENGNPIIFIQHNDEELVLDSPGWQLFSELDVRDTDYFVRKTHANSFYKTNLAELLSELSIHNLEICGAQTEYCVDTTVRMAHGLGYSLTMTRGLHTTLDSEHLDAETIIKHHENIWNSFLTFI